MKIIVLGTDVSKFKETGFGSITSCINVYKALKPVYEDTEFIEIKSVSDIEKVVNMKPDLVICGFKYFIDDKGEKYWMSDIIGKNNITLVGSPFSSIKYDSDKALAKDTLIKNNINTAKFKVVNSKNLKNDIGIEYPIFVKPVDAACSFGVDDKSFVSNYEELLEKVQKIEGDFNQDSLVEEFLPGNEYTVGIIGNGEDILIAPIELSSSYNINGNKFLPRDAKVANIEKHDIVTDTRIKEKIIKLTKEVCRIFKVRDLARVDIKLDNHGEPSFIEINLLPGFSKGTSYFPIAFNLNYGMSYDETVNAVVKAAINRVR